MECFTINSLSFTYPEQSDKALDDLSFSVGQGEFVALVGPSGCGKSTLLRQLKSVLAPHGEVSGEICFEGRPLRDIGQREQSARIGFVLQNPDNQIVTDKVWHELAFGLESLGCATPAIRARVAEMASFFGIQAWFYKDVSELSGGQKQLLNLAAIMTMQPSVLILDEPTSQLDPIAAADFLATVGKINRELGTTVIMTEHRLEEVFPQCDRVLVMDRGALLCEGTPREVGRRLRASGHGMFLSMPAPMRIYAAVPNDLECPVTVRDGRLWLSEFASKHPLSADAGADPVFSGKGTPSVELAEVWFKYGKELPDVLKGLSLKAYSGEFLAVLGGNGTGKTTALSVMSGINRPYRGKVLIEGRELSSRKEGLYDGLLGVLPQAPQALFVKKALKEDLLEILKGHGLSTEEKEKKLASVSRLCRLEGLMGRHPYDLSGGEQQRAALAKVLLLDPKILLLDEPTKGLDAEFKQAFAGILENLLQRGVTVIMVSHDIEFCARYAHRCALFFDGAIVAEDAPRAFFSGNSFYTTAANRMARHLIPCAVTAEDVAAACGAPLPPPPSLTPDDGTGPPAEISEPGGKTHSALPLRRRFAAIVSGGIALAAAAAALAEPDIPWLMGNDKLGLYLVLIVSLTALALAIGRRREKGNADVPLRKAADGFSKRTRFAALTILIAVPLTIFFGVHSFDGRKYYFISLLVLFETMLPFFLTFEGRKPKARELVVISVLCALGVAGRAAFFMLPQFKPVAALVIISGAAFGGETGFLVGAVTMLTSNILFGQGPWTPWQMFAMGIIGLLSGVLHDRGLLGRGRLSLSVFGALAALVIYGGIMNLASAVTWQENLNRQLLFSYYATGLPFDLVHAAATALFLWFISQPMLEKLDRIKSKYGLLENTDEAI